MLRNESPFEDPPHITNESGLALPDQRSWLVVFRLAGRRRLHVFSFENLASRPESCFTWVPAKLLAHFHRQPPRHIFTTREVGSLSGVRVHLASVLRDVSPFRDPPHLTNESGLALPDQRSWLVVFRLLVEDVCTSSVSKTSLLVQKAALHGCLRSCLRISPTTARHIFTTREVGSLSGVRVHLRPCCVTSLLSKIHHTSQTNLASHFRTSEAGSSCSVARSVGDSKEWRRRCQQNS
jgi:hypothetical protein